jgi:hypothetical protein
MNTVLDSGVRAYGSIFSGEERAPISWQPHRSFRAPTWSCAALDGRIDKWRKGGFVADHEGDLAHKHYVELGIFDVNVKHYPNNPFGRVESGYIDIHGPISVPTPMVAEFYDFPDGVDGDPREILDEGYPAQFLLMPDFPTEKNLWT